MGRCTLAVKLNPKANKAELHVVWLRITKDRDAVFLSLSVAIPEKQFNGNGNRQLKNWVRRSCADFSIFNDRIVSALNRAEEAISFFENRELEFSATDVKSYLEQGGLPDRLLPFFAAHIAHRRAIAGGDLGKLKTADGYESSLKVFRGYLRETHKIADSVSDEKIDDSYWLLGKFTKADALALKEWLLQYYAPNSVTSYLRNLRHVLYLAADKGLVSFERFPMRGISLTIKRKNVQRLHEGEIEQLATAPAPTKHRGGHPSVTSPKHARPLAMMMYLAHGARIGDAITWRAGAYTVEGDQHRLRYNTGKNKRSMSVLLDREAIELLAPYLVHENGTPKQPDEFLFPYLPANFDKLKTADQYLEVRKAKGRARKQIIALGERVGLTKRLTPHVMRHSFADMMRRSGVDMQTRQEALGHADMKTTINYQEQFDQEAVDKVSLLYQNRKNKT
ncbi:tyrosine-type recombinase/integrase [Fibrella forsythiae]|uniref:Tyrosine-type recombinase/integrase n=1 Tax=Fibrella forsythiae TaxID=2817061 RepID=A0ABS3JE64_9BACT|nr:tyrosine-type recombinase/integrase [Fibrella forsythiae]MBO0947564.1 tyrosine-type recombinase/integrase [Fibrella forsythiae]